MAQHLPRWQHTPRYFQWNSTTQIHGQIVFDFRQNPDCLLWATMALLVLETKLPSQTLANRRAEDGLEGASILRAVFSDVLGQFSIVLDDGREQTWVDSGYQQGRNTVFMLLEAWYNYHEEMEREEWERTAGTINKVLYALDILLELTHALVDTNAAIMTRWTADEMDWAVTREVQRVLGGIVDDLVKSWKEEDVPNDRTPMQVHQFVLNQLGHISTTLEDHMRDQPLLKVHGNFDPQGRMGEAFARIVELRGRDVIYNAIHGLVTSLGNNPQGTPTQDLVLTTEFYKNIASLFSWKTPIFRSLRTARELIPPSPISVLNLEENEMEVDVRDASVEDVSHEILNVANAECPICADQPPLLRRLTTCVHVFCGPCLNTQINTNIDSSRRCAMCREPMLDPGDYHGDDNSDS